MKRPRRPAGGFTLVELMIVITIIGILIGFILQAAIGGIRNAEKTATTSLIAKLEAALNDRIDALSGYRAEPTWAHYALAAIYPGGGAAPIQGNQRAQVIANFDYMRAELPDVFVVDTSDTDYPLNFAAPRINPLGGAASGTAFDYTLPLGAGVADPVTGTIPTITGMKGASFAAWGGLLKQLGYSPRGYDGVDSDSDGFADDRDEGNAGLTPDLRAQIDTRLANHRHKTARSEMLYALLVEGIGPLGSVFNKDDFNVNEVRDTDGDGMLEFVDAWGEPLQFYRWPIMYRSDVQKGFPDLTKITQDYFAGTGVGPYSTVYEAREQDPLDPNQQLVAPGWWGVFNAAYPWGSARNTFAAMFHTLVDPLAVTSGAAMMTTYWDRSSNTGGGPHVGCFQRRAYYSRFLVLSGGPDKTPGTAMLGVDYRSLDERSAFPLRDGTTDATRDATGALVPINVANVITIENQGGRIDPNRNPAGCPVLPSGRNDTNTQLEDYGMDDITSHNLHAAGGPLPSGR